MKKAGSAMAHVSSKSSLGKRMLLITCISAAHFVLFIFSLFAMVSQTSHLIRFGQHEGVLGPAYGAIVQLLLFPISVLTPVAESVGVTGPVQWVFIGLNSIIWGVAIYYAAIGLRNILKSRRSRLLPTFPRLIHLSGYAPPA